jgi:hypothetical protein
VSGRHGSTRTLKKILLSLMAIGAAASLSVGGTYAILSSQETNASSTIATGTLTFSNTVGTGTACYSYGGPSSPANENASCDTLFPSPSLLYPGSSSTSRLTLTNNGSVAIGDLGVYMPSCSMQASPGAGASAGGGDPCSYITDGVGNPDGPLLSIQETDSSGNPTFCWWPDGVSGACDPGLVQDDWFGIVAQFITTEAGELDLGAGPAVNSSRYFTITVSLPANADPTLQGEEALFSLAWHVTT